jgi:hypothetical protein
MRRGGWDPDGPSLVRQTAGDGETAVMPSSWRDPDDIRPSARRTAKEIAGYRTYCPLRRMMRHKGSSITVQHIIAADELRVIFDLARLGYSIGTNASMTFVTLARISPMPRLGPTRAAMAQGKAWRELRRALARFTDERCAMLDFIVLRNHSMRAWCAVIGQKDRNREMGRLVAILDLLADHFASEVDARMSRGEVLAM